MFRIEEYAVGEIPAEKALADVQDAVIKGDFYFDGDINAEGDEIAFAHMPECSCKTQECIETQFDGENDDLSTEVDNLISAIRLHQVRGLLRYRMPEKGCAKQHWAEEPCIEFKPQTVGTLYLKVFTMVDKRKTRHGVELRRVPVIDCHY